ncbi:PadR family transcriptional regulator [Hydrogenoanaerobacterium sp.]|uniref:PadR family transcriptional regulator n=1 Tax=Hydrogenoanaerobacterium sp. TaxID=2953763 RepID=UPI002898FF9F|nr:PadR family transcriptional regulator [Hydrogenoanaerobacterium sp.]
MTRLLVLGLLDEQPMSGYDIQQKISRADAERWGGVLVGSIYHALKKLEQENYIELTGVEQTGHRQKAIYKTTDQGKNYLQSIIIDSLRTSSVIYPTTLYSGLSLLYKIPYEKAREALEEQKKLLDEEYHVLEQGQKTNEAAAQDTSPLSRITMDNMFAIIRQQQQFIEKILEVLDEQNK